MNYSQPFGFLISILLSVALLFGAMSLAVDADESDIADDSLPEPQIVEEPAPENIQTPVPPPTPAPTVAPPTARPSVEMVPEATQTELPTPAPTPVPVNVDSLTLEASTSEGSLDPGETRLLAFDYHVTTPRHATSFVAEITSTSGSDSAWTIQLIVGDTRSEVDTRVSVDSFDYPNDGTISFSVVVTAPTQVVAEETSSLWIGSTVQRLDGGSEKGIQALEPVAWVVVAPTPSATSTASPTNTSNDPNAEETETTHASPQAELTVGAGEPTATATSAFLPDRTLTCVPGVDIAIPGATVEITCSIPEAAWALRGNTPTYAFSIRGDLQQSSRIGVAGPVFSTAIPIPCAIDNDTIVIDANATLGPGLTMSTRIQLPVDRSMIPSSRPVLTHSGLAFTTSQWTAAGWTPVVATVVVDVNAGTSECAKSNWRVSSSITVLTNGDDEIAVSFEYLGGSSASQAINVLPAGMLAPGHPIGIASGSGSGTLVLQFRATLPATAPAGSYRGDITFDLANGP